MNARSFAPLLLLGALSAFACTSVPVEPATDDDTSSAHQKLCVGDTCWDCSEVPVPNGTSTYCDTPCTGDDGDVYECPAQSGGDSKCPPSNNPPATTGDGTGNGGGDGTPADAGAGGGDEKGGGDKGGNTGNGGNGGGHKGGDGAGDGGAHSGGGAGGGQCGGGPKCHVEDGKRGCQSPPKCSPGSHPEGGACVPDVSCGCGDTPGGSGSGSPGGNGGNGGNGGSSSVGGGCTLTQGFWKNHAAAWPVQSLTIGGVAYTKTELITILRTAPQGDASLILVHQLIATMLNAASGASQAQVGAAVADAQAWMTANNDADGKLPYGVSSSSAAGTTATSISSKLDTYNNGGLGTPHCG